MSAIGRVASEEAATTALRATLAASESLAVLAPRLANVHAQIERETPDNPEPERRRLVARRGYLERTARPGILTRAGRNDRHALRSLDDRIDTLQAEAANRDRWLSDHADLFAYRDDLARQVASRREAQDPGPWHSRPAAERRGPPNSPAPEEYGGDSSTRSP